MDGSDLKQISDRGQHPRWSPDGRKIAFSDGTNLFTINADGTNRRQLTDVGGQQRYLTPFWTPDSDQIVTEYYRLGTHDAWVQIDPETGERYAVGAAARPLLRLHARRLADRAVGLVLPVRLRAPAPDGTDRQAVPQPIQGRDCMTLSPDNRYGVTKKYRSDSDSRIDIIVWDLQTKQERNLTNGNGGYQGYSTWSPTGEWIVWGSNKERSGATGYGATDIWKIRPDGTGATKIVDGAEPVPQLGAPGRAAAPRRRARARADARGAQARRPRRRRGRCRGREITLDASARSRAPTTPRSSSYEWDLDGDGVYTDAEGVAPKTTFHDEGTYAVAVLVTDAKGKSATATAEVTVTNAAPTIADARVDDGEPASFSARITDPGVGDIQTAKVFWNGSATGETVPVMASGERLRRDREPPGRDEREARRHRRRRRRGRGRGDARRGSADALPSAGNATATVVAGEAVDLDLPARDPEGAPLEYEIVDEPAHGLGADARPVARRRPRRTSPTSRRTRPGPVTFTYRVKAGGGQSGVATVTVDVKPRPDDPGEVVVPGERPIEPDQPPVARPTREGAKPVDQRVVEELTGEAPKAITRAEQVATLPSTKSCVSRRNFRIRVKQGDYRKVTVSVNGKRVKVLRGLRDTATVDLRGLPKGRFKVQIAVTLKSGKVVRSTRHYRTCTPKTKKGGRA